MTTYTAVARRSGGWWAISVPELKGVHTQARRLDQVPRLAQDAIALMLDVEPATITVKVEAEVPDTVSSAIEARRKSQAAARNAEHATASAVRFLLGGGYTVRDVGAMLHISPARVSQIARSGDKSSSIMQLGGTARRSTSRTAKAAKAKTVRTGGQAKRKQPEMTSRRRTTRRAS